MKTTKKRISFFLILALVFTMLTGCMAEELKINFNSDGSGQLEIGIYLSEEFITSLGSTPEEIFTDEDGNTVTIVSKYFNNAKYYGTTSSEDFKSIDELRQYLISDEEESAVTMGSTETIQNGKKLVTLSGIVSSDAEIANDAGATSEDLDALGVDISNMLTITLSITFPDGVQMIDVPKDSYRVSGNTVHVRMTSGQSEQHYCITGSLGDVDAGNTTGLNNFIKKYNYEKQFTDIALGSWYEESLGRMYEYGIVNGTSATTFNPKDKLSLAQIITLGARVHAIYNSCEDTAFASNPGGYWFSPYVMYAYQTGIIEPGVFDESADQSVLNRPATRAEMAYVIARCLPESEYSTDKEYTGFNDVSVDNPYAKYIETLYKAGIVIGTGGNNYSPNALVDRCQAVVFVDRLLNNSK